MALADGLIQAAQSSTPEFAKLGKSLLPAGSPADLFARDLAGWARRHLADDAQRLYALCSKDGWLSL